MSGALDHRTAVVTGASRGIGLATARALVRAGARVALLARRADVLASRAAELGPGATAVVCDVSDPDDVQRAAARVERELGGAPDVLVNNAGLFTLAPVAETAPSSFAAAVAVNLVAPFLFVRAFLPGMRSRGSGDIVTIGSVADRAIYPENAAYAASKHGARALHEVMRAELRGSGIRSSLVSPGSTDTELWDIVAGREGFLPRTEMLRPDDVADAVLFALTRPPGVNVDELRLSPA